jgi:hypothetical protein
MAGHLEGGALKQLTRQASIQNANYGTVSDKKT